MLSNDFKEDLHRSIKISLLIYWYLLFLGCENVDNELKFKKWAPFTLIENKSGIQKVLHI